MKVASLEFDLLANIARLQQDMTKAQQIMGRSLSAIEQSVERTMNTFNRMGNMLGVLLGGSIASKVIELADDWGQYASRMKMATQSTAEYERAQSRMMQSAQATFRPINETREAFINLSPVLRDMGMTLDQSIDAVDAFSGLLVTAGANAQRGASAMNALEKSFQRGKVSAQDWMTIYSTADGILEHLQITTGKSAEELRRLGVDGKLSATQLANALTSAYGPVMEQVANMPTTIGDAMTNMRTAFGEYIGSMNEGLGITSKVADGISLLAENIDLLMIGIGILSAAALPALIAKITALTVAIATNPIGLLAVAISASIVYLISLRDEIDKFGKEMDALGAVWDMIKGGFVAIWEVGKSAFESLVQKVSSSTEGMELSFDSAFMAITGALDTFHGALLGSFAALNALWETSAHNLRESFSFAFHKIREIGSEVVAGIAESLNEMLGTKYQISAYVAPSNKPDYLPVGEAMAKAFKEHQGGLGLQSIYRDASDKRKIEREIGELEGWYKELYGVVDEGTGVLNNNSGALDKNKKKLTEAQKAAKKFAEEREAALKKQYEGISALQEERRTLEDQIKTFGMGKRAIEQLTITRLKEQAAVLAGFEGSKEVVELLRLEIEEREKLLQAGFTLDGLERSKKAAQDLAEATKQTHDDIEKSLTDALLRGFESGKDFARNFIDTLKNMFGSLVLRPIIQPIAAGLAGAVTGMLGLGGTANAQGVDAMSGASWLSKLMSGGGAGQFGMQGGMSWFSNFGGNVSNSIADFGANLAMSNSAFSEFGVSLLNNAEALGNFANMAGTAFSYGKGILDLTKGKYGSGIGAIGGQLIGGPIGSIIGSTLGGMLDKAFSGEKRGGGYYQLKDGAAIKLGGASGGDGGQQTVDAVGQLFASAQGTIDGLFKSLGVNASVAFYEGMFEDSKKGRGGVFSGGLLDVDGQQVSFGTNKKGAGYGGKSGTLEEMFENLQKDLAFSTLEAWKSVSDQMPHVIGDMLTSIDVRSLSAEQAQGLVAEISNTVGSINALSDAFNQMPMENLRNLTFDATHALQGFAGGIDAIAAGVGTYYQNFHSESERQMQSLSGMASQLSVLNQSFPVSKAGFRELADGLDLSTEAGQQLYATLMNMSGAAASFYDYVAQQSESSFATISASISASRDDYLASLQEQHQAAQKAIRDEYSAKNQAIRSSITSINEKLRDLNSVFTALGSGIKSLREQSELASQLHREASLRVIEDAIAASKAGKSLTNIAQLQDSIQSASKLDANNFTSLFDFELERAETVNRLKELESLTGGQIDVQELQLNTLNKQLEQLGTWQDKQLELLQKQYEEEQEIAKQRFEKMMSDEKMRFELQLTEMLNEQANQLLINDSINVGAASTVNGLSAVQRAVDASASRISSAISNIKISVTMPSPTSGLGLPAFADGGYYSGGLALVGERGPEIINFAQPGMVYTAAQSRNLMSGDGDKEMARLMLRLIDLTVDMSSELKSVVIKLNSILGLVDDVTEGGSRRVAV